MNKLPQLVKPWHFFKRDFINLHDVTEAFLTEDILEEDQVFLMVSIRMKLRGEQGQSLMQPYGQENNTTYDSKLWWQLTKKNICMKLQR